MVTAPNCRVCSGALELAWRGRVAFAPSSIAFAPTCHATGEHGDLLRCLECGTVQQPALPNGEALLELYRDMSDEAYLEEEAGRREAARRILDLVAEQVARGQLLDVGCGHGLLLDEARSRGYDVVGLELARSAAAHARDVLGLRVRETTLDDPTLDDERFAVIVLADVLEHVDDPCATLDRCTSLLAEGGAIVVITPDPASLVARLAGRRWWALLPAHTFLIPHRTLLELLTGRGLVVSRVAPFVRSFTPSYWLAGLAERLPFKRQKHHTAAGTPRRLWSLPLGDECVVIARQVTVQEPAQALATPRGKPLSVHAVLPAYKAARTVSQVAEEMPVRAIDRALLVDDASPDETTSAALAAGFSVLRHPTNRGYGANQKSCYVRAALDGADIVVMVHGDNQYDPSLLAQMVRPIEDGVADVVIGSRLLQDKAIAGGMPRWKWVGNRALTWVENKAFRQSFSEYHTGYRAFRVDTLRGIAFCRNNDDFVFDQQVFAQLIATDARIAELAIPTRYFLEASSVSFQDSVVYGLKTLGVLARYRLHGRTGRWTILRGPAVSLPSVAASPAAPR